GGGGRRPCRGPRLGARDRSRDRTDRGRPEPRSRPRRSRPGPRRALHVGRDRTPHARGLREAGGSMSPASKVSLITTVKNASRYVGAWLDSVASQTRPPDEVIVVDGGSTDGTREVLRAAQSITLIEEPGANIARGRNGAIQAPVHD